MLIRYVCCCCCVGQWSADCEPSIVAQMTPRNNGKEEARLPIERFRSKRMQTVDTLDFYSDVTAKSWEPAYSDSVSNQLWENNFKSILKVLLQNTFQKYFENTKQSSILKILLKVVFNMLLINQHVELLQQQVGVSAIHTSMYTHS